MTVIVNLVVDGDWFKFMVFFYRTVERAKVGRVKKRSYYEHLIRKGAAGRNE